MPVACKDASAPDTASFVIVCESVTSLLFGAADVLQVGDEGRLALMQRPLQLFKRTGNLHDRLGLPLVQLAGDLAHQLDGCRQLREPARRHNVINVCFFLNLLCFFFVFFFSFSVSTPAALLLHVSI